MFTNTLPKGAQNALAVLGKKPCLPPRTYLAGGSALALHYGHRISVDFDFFTPKDFNAGDITQTLKQIGTFTVDTALHDSLLGNFDNVRFSLFRYTYPLLFKTANFSGIAIADPKDIAAMKIAAIMDRGTKKDFIDLFYIVKHGDELEKCLGYYDDKYQALANNVYSIITSLSYFTDAQYSDVPKMLKEVSWEEITMFFEKESIRLAKKFL